MDNKNMTFHHFYSNMRSFLSRLISSPINAELPNDIKAEGISKNEMIQKLLDRDIISRHERILDKTNSDYEKPTYSVKYKVFKKNFERKMHRLYSYYFENNDRKKINECDCGSCMGGGEGGGTLFGNGAGATTTNSTGDYGYDVIIGKTPVKRQKHIYEPKPKTKKKKRIHISESQAHYLREFYGIENMGDMILNEEGELSTDGATNSNISANSAVIKPMGKGNKAGGLVLTKSNGEPDNEPYKR